VEEWFYITFPALILTIVTTIGGAIISWRFVERPCLKLRPGQPLP